MVRGEKANKGKGFGSLSKLGRESLETGREMGLEWGESDGDSSFLSFQHFYPDFLNIPARYCLLSSLGVSQHPGFGFPCPGLPCPHWETENG